MGADEAKKQPLIEMVETKVSDKTKDTKAKTDDETKAPEAKAGDEKKDPKTFAELVAQNNKAIEEGVNDEDFASWNESLKQLEKDIEYLNGLSDVCCVFKQPTWKTGVEGSLLILITATICTLALIYAEAPISYAIVIAAVVLAVLFAMSLWGSHVLSAALDPYKRMKALYTTSFSMAKAQFTLTKKLYGLVADLKKQNVKFESNNQKLETSVSTLQEENTTNKQQHAEQIAALTTSVSDFRAENTTNKQQHHEQIAALKKKVGELNGLRAGLQRILTETAGSAEKADILADKLSENNTEFMASILGLKETQEKLEQSQVANTELATQLKGLHSELSEIVADLDQYRDFKRVEDVIDDYKGQLVTMAEALRQTATESTRSALAFLTELQQALSPSPDKDKRRPTTFFSALHSKARAATGHCVSPGDRSLETPNTH